MKRLIYIFLLFTTLTGCIKKSVPYNTDRIVLSKALSENLTDLIKQDSSAKSTKLYVVRFVIRNNKTFVVIYKTYFYHKELVDGYFFIDNNLVVIYMSKNLKMRNIIDQSKLVSYNDSIPNYLDMSRCDMQFEIYPRKFQIVSPDSLRQINETDTLFRKL